MSRTLILGGPGAGKTTRLLSILEAAFDRGLHPSEVAFVSFTNAAADEARSRARERFNLGADDVPYFRTLHSLAFKELRLDPRAIFNKATQVEELAEITGEQLDDGATDPDEWSTQGAMAHPFFTIDHYARATMTSLRSAWEAHCEQGGDTDWWQLLRFVEAYRTYREDRDLFDYTDMLERYVAAGLPPVPVKLAIIDEAQDLTLLQWRVAEAAFRSAADVYAAGDDDQSIHRWAGAAEDHLLSLDWNREVLPLSHRLPNQVFDLSMKLAGEIGRRFEKSMQPSGRDGVVDWVTAPGEADLTNGTWLMLARTRYLLQPYVEEARAQGVAYIVNGKPSVKPEHVHAIKAYEALRRGKEIGGDDAQVAMKYMEGKKPDVRENRTYTAKQLGIDVGPIWHEALVRMPVDDREYYHECLKRDRDSLTKPPRVRISTIHGAKGAEAENVLLSTDLTKRVVSNMEHDPDGEHRVFYTGVTRASANLMLQVPSSPYAYRPLAD